MLYEKEILSNLLKESGLSHRLNDRIKPSKHPYMKMLEKSLKANEINYMYFPHTDSLAVTQVNLYKHVNLCHTLMMPSDFGISVLIIMNAEADMDMVLDEVSKSLDKIVPNGIGYDIVGVF